MINWKIASVGLLAIALTSPGLAQEWKYLPKKEGMGVALIAETPQSGKSNRLLILQCRAGENGTTSILYRVNDTQKIAGFKFKNFEGLDARGSKQKLFSVKVDDTTVNAAVGGWYVADDDFLFSFTALHGRNADMKRILQALLGPARKVTVQVRDPDDAKNTLQTTFPAPDAGALKKSLKGCL